MTWTGSKQPPEIRLVDIFLLSKRGIFCTLELETGVISGCLGFGLGVLGLVIIKEFLLCWVIGENCRFGVEGILLVFGKGANLAPRLILFGLDFDLKRFSNKSLAWLIMFDLSITVDYFIKVTQNIM